MMLKLTPGHPQMTSHFRDDIFWMKHLCEGKNKICFLPFSSSSMVVELSVDSFTSPDLLPLPAPAMERAEKKPVENKIKSKIFLIR